MASALPDVPSLLSFLTSFFAGFKTRFVKVLPALGTISLLQLHDTLVPLAFAPLPLGSIAPSGWLKDQMQLMADGLAGHEYDFYKYVANSRWLGQNDEYSGLNEGLPYWFNGLVPLAYGLDDARLKDQVHSVAEYILDHQWGDGWIGPEYNHSRNLWPRWPLFLGMIGLSEANTTWEARVVPALHKFVDLMHEMLKDNYDDETMWGLVRYPDMIIALQWLLEHHVGDRRRTLLESMVMLHDFGMKWEDWYSPEAYLGGGLDRDLNTLDEDLTDDNFPFEHGVNVAQGLKAAAVIRRFTHDDTLIDTAMNGVNWTMTFHGAPSGTILADERLVGLAPYSGSEFCTSVEAAYSLAYLYQALGSNYYADQAELIAFNDIPAHATPDWWARSYVTQPNQPYVMNMTTAPYFNTNSWANTFGLESHFPCSMSESDQTGLLSPGSAAVLLSSGQLTVRCDTGYPFADTLRYTIQSEGPAAFYVRIPAWAGSDATIVVGAETLSVSPHPETGLHGVSLLKGTTSITYTLPSKIRTESRANDTIAVYKGAVLYALEITNFNSSTRPKPYTNPGFGLEYRNESYAPSESRDWVYKNTSPWNYAIDPSTLTYHGADEGHSTSKLANPLFAPGAPPGYMTARACKIDWPMAFDGSVPGFPPVGDARACIGRVVEVKLVVCASARTHMSELPVVDLSFFRR